MPRRPTLSPTKLTCYLACPHKYYWAHLNPKGQWFLKAHRYFTFGLSLHRALEAFHRGGETGIPVKDALQSALEDHWIGSGYASAEEQQVAFGQAKDIVGAIAEDLATGDRPPAEVLGVEKSLRKSMGDWDLIGRADRIDRIEGDPPVIDVIDYKSGRDDVSESDIAQDVAMSSYVLMVRDRFPGNAYRATIHALRANRAVSHDFSHEELDEFEFSVKELGNQVLNHHWDEMRPVRKPLCVYCEFRPLCRRVPGYDEDSEDADGG